MVSIQTNENFPFVGRKLELRQLKDLFDKKVASLAVITGRRRVGKSRLIEEFIKGNKHFMFSGLPPLKKTTQQAQRNEFMQQFSAQTGDPEVQVDDWSKIFRLLAQKTSSGRIIIVLDEISWMGSKDDDFLGKLKNAWDLYFKKNPNLILILCGSVSSWIEKNIISSTGFFGRIAFKLALEEMSLQECNVLIESIGFKRSLFEKFMLLCVSGGIPWYIELFNPKHSALENIRTLCFTKNGILANEFKYIFHDLFGRRAKICQKIVQILAQGPLERKGIAEKLNYARSGSLDDYLEDLRISGFVRRDHVWDFQSGKETRLSQFRLKDNYLRFYLKYILPNLEKIKKNQFSEISLSSLPHWNSILGFQFENLVINNRREIHALLGIKPEEIISDNPYFQHATQKQRGCQLDYLIQTRQNTLFVFEIKFSNSKIDSSIINEVKIKIQNFNVPKSFACLPVLIHVNGVNDGVIESDYFYKIIDFSELL